MKLMATCRRIILLIATGLFIYQLREGWNQLSDPDLLEVKTNLDLKSVDPPLIAVCPNGQLQRETLHNYDYHNYTNMLNGRIQSSPNVLAWGFQKNMSFDNMTRNMIDQEMDVSLETSEHFQERKFHPELGICWLVRPSFKTKIANVMNLDFTVQWKGRDTTVSDTENGKDKSGTDNVTGESDTDYGTEDLDDSLDESGMANGSNISDTNNDTDESITDNDTEESGTENDTLEYGTYNYTEESRTDLGREESEESEESSKEYRDKDEDKRECEEQQPVQIFFLDENMNTFNTFSLAAHKGDVISLSGGGFYEYEVNLKVVSSFNPKNNNFCNEYLKDEYASCVDDNSQNIFMPVFGCNPPWFSPTNSCTGKIKNIK